MSLILKGIDLPEKNKGLYVYIFNGKAEVVHPLDACEVVHTGAEAVQIPKGHGDIKDVSRLYPSTIEKMEYGGDDGRAVYHKRVQVYTEKDIENAPTILGMEE